MESQSSAPLEKKLETLLATKEKVELNILNIKSDKRKKRKRTDDKQLFRHQKDEKSTNVEFNFNQNILQLIFLNFAPRELVALSLVCKKWGETFRKESLWRNILLLRSGDIYSISYIERLKVEVYAKKLLVLFNKKSFNQQLTRDYPNRLSSALEDKERDNTRDRLENFLKEKISPRLEVAMMKEFLIKNPRFNIEERTSVWGELSLPIILWDLGLHKALKYLLSQRQYDKNEVYGGTESLIGRMTEVATIPADSENTDCRM